MPRPKKLTLDFFIHDANARNDRKIKALRRRHGNDGYATFFCLVEMLCQEDGMRMPLSNPLDIETVAEECGVRDSAHLLNIIQCCTEIGLLDKQLWESERIVFSPGLYKRYLARLEERKQAALRKQRQADASKLAKRIQEVQAKENEVFPRDNPVSSRDNSPELQNYQNYQNDQNAQSENLKSEGEKTETKNLDQSLEPARHHDRPEPNPVQSNPVEPQPTGQDDYSATADFVLKREIHPTEQCDRRFRQEPWGFYSSPDPGFLDFLIKNHLCRVDPYKNYPKVTRHHAKAWLVDAQYREDRYNKASIQWDAYQDALREAAATEEIRHTAEIIPLPLPTPQPVTTTDRAESLNALIRAGRAESVKSLLAQHPEWGLRLSEDCMEVYCA